LFLVILSKIQGFNPQGRMFIFTILKEDDMAIITRTRSDGEE